MKVLLHSHFPAGHAYPMQAVAHALTARGHEVVWLTSPDNRARVAASGASFAPTSSVLALDEPLARAGATGLLDDDPGVLEGRLLAQVADYRRVLRGGAGGFDADVVLVDVMPHGARALHELGEVPAYATLGVIPMYTSSPASPRASSGRAPPSSWIATLVNGLVHLFRRFVLVPWTVRPILNRQRRLLGLAPLPYAQPLEAFSYSPLLHIQASSPTLEFNHAPSMVRRTGFVGPLVMPAATSPSTLPGWWDRVLSHPRVIGITQGTLATNPTSLIVPSVLALRDDPRNLVVVVSPHAEAVEAQLGPRRNVLFAAWLPYHVLLPRLRLLVTNGGYGSITQALSHSVPLVCAGQTEDKKDTAARVAWAGAGIDLGTDSPSPRQVGEAAARILDDDGDDVSYREQAARLGSELDKLGGASTVCSLLEELVNSHPR